MHSSPFKVDLGTLVFNLFYQNVFLGAGTGPNSQIVSHLVTGRGHVMNTFCSNLGPLKSHSKGVLFRKTPRQTWLQFPLSSLRI